jgi:hypothetical protein
MTTEKKVIPEFKPVKKLSPFVGDPHNSRGGGKGNKKSAITSSGVTGKKMNAASSIKKGGSGDR